MPEKFSTKATRSLQLDMLAILLLPCVSAWYFYGAKALRLIAVSVIVSVLCEFFGRKLLRQPATVSDLSAVTTGLFNYMLLRPDF